MPCGFPKTVNGVVIDAVRRTAIAGAQVMIWPGDNVSAAKIAVTDNAGAYTIPGLESSVYRGRASARGYDSGEQVFQIPFTNIGEVRVNFELRPALTPSTDYAGVWMGVYNVTDCRDLEVVGVGENHHCDIQRSQRYQFTLTQIGTLVSGTYKMLSPFYNCVCPLMAYGDVPMAGSISPDGTLAITALGSGAGTAGVTVELDLVLHQPSASTITGTGTIHLRSVYVDNSIGSVVVQSGTRAQ
jgi:hypothetical protein